MAGDREGKAEKPLPGKRSTFEERFNFIVNMLAVHDHMLDDSTIFILKLLIEHERKVAVREALENHANGSETKP